MQITASFFPVSPNAIEALYLERTMTYQDLLITPIYLAIFYFLAYVIRPSVTTPATKTYFIPALSAKFFGAIALGMIYQFYYGGGDTFTYFHLGSRWIYEAFWENPLIAMELIFNKSQVKGKAFYYASRMYTYGDTASHSITRLSGFFDLFTFHTYSATALCFAFLSFSGTWMIFSSFEKIFPSNTRILALGILFFPSLIFWGSGLLKDSITLAAVGWMFWGISEVLFFKRNYAKGILLFLVAFYTLYLIKIYILLCLLPALAYWVYRLYSMRIRNSLVRTLMAPFLLSVFSVAGYYGVILVGEENARYSTEVILYTAEETAKWNYYVSERGGGSGYTLGDYDFSPAGLLRKFPLAVATTLFRPFLFEARNPVMLLSAMENTIILLLFLHMFFSKRIKMISKNHVLTFSLIFVVLFSFAVGVTTYNFGSLVRYKIPMLPFLAATLLLVNYGRFESPIERRNE